MNYDDYRTHLKVCEYLDREPTGEYKKMYDFLTDLWEGMEFVVDSRSGLFIIQKTGGWNRECDRFREDGGWYMSPVGRYVRCNGQKMKQLFSTTEDKLFLRDALFDHLDCSDLTLVVDKRFCPYFIEKENVVEMGLPS